MALPMPKPTVPPLPLSEYKILSFDVYGTLIQYKSHILDSFQPLISRLPSSSPYRDTTPLAQHIPEVATVGSIEFLKLFQREEDKIKLEVVEPARNFSEILVEIWKRIARKLEVHTTDDEALNFGSRETIASWPVFPGTVEALRELSRRYKLVALSNIDKYAWSITCNSEKSPLGDVEWWKVFTAEDFGSDLKKADDAKLETLTQFVIKSGLKRSEILHIAQSLGHDHAPAKRQGLSSVFLIGDGPKWGKESESKMALEKERVGYAWRCIDLKEFAGVVEKTCHGNS